MILIGEGEWDGLLAWLRSRVLADGRIDERDLALFNLASDAAHACELIDAARERQREHARHHTRRGSRAAPRRAP